MIERTPVGIDTPWLMSACFQQWLCVPFVLMGGASHTDLTQSTFNNTSPASWLGRLESKDVGRWIDNFLVLVG